VSSGVMCGDLRSPHNIVDGRVVSNGGVCGDLRSPHNIVDGRVVSNGVVCGDLGSEYTTPPDTTRPSTIFSRLLLNCVSLRRH
jgi:hypothetical protein